MWRRKMRKIWYHIKNWFVDMSEAFTDMTKKCVLSSSSIQVFFYIVFAAILVGSLAGDVVVIRSLAVLVLAFFMALGLGISIRNTIDIHRDCKKMLDRQHSCEKGCECCGRYSIFAPLPTICLGDEEGVDLPVDYISITVKQEDSAGLWEVNEKDNADSGFYCSVSDPSVCLNVVGKVEESDFLKREQAEWEWIDAGLSGGVCGGGHVGIDG